MRIVLTLVVRDEAEIIADQLDYHLAAGVHFVIATDHRSRDGTREILQEYEQRGVLELIREDGEYLEQGAWQTRMARLASVRYEADWILTSDADEFWFPRGESMEASLAAVPAEFGVVRASTQNFVPLQDDSGSFAETMIFRFAAPVPVNDPATPYRPVVKVAHRAAPDAVMAGKGGHQVFGVPGALLVHWHPLDILHFPIRSSSQCGRKYRRTWTGWEVNLRADLDRARRAAEQDAADPMWNRVALDAAGIARGLEEGALVKDTRLRDALRAVREGKAALTGGRHGRRRGTGYPQDVVTFREAELVRTARWLDGLAARIAWLEESGSRVRSAS
jgi:hypothetical protein